MKCLRIGIYQPFTAELVKRHALMVACCLVLSLPWLAFLPDWQLRAAGAFLAVFLVLLSVLDGYYGFLYDRLLLPLGAAGFLLEFWGLLPAGFEEALAASVAAGGFWALVRFASGGGLGWGDVKFAAVLGLWLGGRGMAVAAALAVLLGGAASAALLLRGWGKEAALPFGPFLSLGAYVSYIYGDMLWQQYWELAL